MSRYVEEAWKLVTSFEHTFIGMSGLKQSIDNNLKSIVGVAAAAIGAGALYFYSKQKKSCCSCCSCSSCSCGPSKSTKAVRNHTFRYSCDVDFVYADP
jgi:hypothetical protein